ncbi:hypothetical protein [Sphingopyxis sp.]|uniref:hypothetical protein n=1 Tax=Sphingopyxis sp. TaxID=1908224 RepID=UPI0025D83F6E|nr:hypothetical protein [Sphingopyxis sp.]MBK6414321.1 hypothetical protein [Sphingopyxis sp.]
MPIIPPIESKVPEHPDNCRQRDRKRFGEMAGKFIQPRRIDTCYDTTLLWLESLHNRAATRLGLEYFVIAAKANSIVIHAGFARKDWTGPKYLVQACSVATLKAKAAATPPPRQASAGLEDHCQQFLAASALKQR